MSNGMEIKTKDDFAELYEKNPGMAIGIVFENIVSVKEEVSCKFNEFEKKIDKELKPKRFKDFLFQFPGGAIGGAIAAFFIIKYWIIDIILTK